MWIAGVQFSSVAQSCLTLTALCDTMDCSTPGLPVHHQLPEFTQTHVHWVCGAIQPSDPLSSLLLPPSIVPSIRVISSEINLRIRCPKYWSFSFSISPSNEHSGLISFMIDWFNLPAVQGTLKSAPTVQSINSSALSFLYSFTYILKGCINKHWMCNSDCVWSTKTKNVCSLTL